MGRPALAPRDGLPRAVRCGRPPCSCRGRSRGRRPSGPLLFGSAFLAVGAVLVVRRPAAIGRPDLPPDGPRDGGGGRPADARDRARPPARPDPPDRRGRREPLVGRARRSPPSSSARSCSRGFPTAAIADASPRSPTSRSCWRRSILLATPVRPGPDRRAVAPAADREPARRRRARDDQRRRPVQRSRWPSTASASSPRPPSSSVATGGPARSSAPRSAGSQRPASCRSCCSWRCSASAASSRAGSATLLWTAWILSTALLPIAIGIAVLRYRLYDIDRIVSRSISYAIVTGILGATFVITILGLQALLVSFTQSQTIAVAASTLVAASLFQPLRRARPALRGPPLRPRARRRRANRLGVCRAAAGRRRGRRRRPAISRRPSTDRSGRRSQGLWLAERAE